MPKPKTTNLKKEDILMEVAKKFETLQGGVALKDIEIEEAHIGNENLTYMQRLFVNSYCNHMNANKAAVECGISIASASQRGGQYLRSPKIQRAIIKRLNALSMVSAINREVVLVELYQMFQETQAEARQDRHLQLKILDLISKMQGFYNTGPQLNITDNSLEGIKIQIVTNEGISNGSTDQANAG
jgi:hypothetical protein